MKKLSYKGRNFLYEVQTYRCGDYGASDCYETIVYDSEPVIRKRRKYLLFGPVVDVKRCKVLFTLYFNIEDPKYTKEYVEEKLDAELVLLNRLEDIQRGDIVGKKSQEFPNGFTNWHETHFEIVQEIAQRLSALGPVSEDCVVQQRQKEQGHGGLYELAQELTDEFEKKYEDVAWGEDEVDGEILEFYETIEAFCFNKLKK